MKPVSLILLMIDEQRPEAHIPPGRRPLTEEDARVVSDPKTKDAR